MLRIKALNEDTTSGSDSCEDESQEMQLTREAQEENLHSLYTESLKYLKDGQEDKAKEMLLQLLDTLNSSETQNMVSAKQLRFLASKNLGMLCPNDINYFLDALEIDSTDISLWTKAGRRAYDVFVDFQLARNCFEAAHQLNPKNWLVVDNLLDCYFVLHDLHSCFELATKALTMDASYRKAQVLIYETCRLHPSLKKLLRTEHVQQSRLTPDQMSSYSNLMETYRLKKKRRAEKSEEDRIRNEPKHPKLVVTSNFSHSAFKIIGNQLLSVWKQMDKDGIPVFTPIDLEIEEKALEFAVTRSSNSSEEKENEEKADAVAPELDIIKGTEAATELINDIPTVLHQEKLEQYIAYEGKPTVTVTGVEKDVSNSNDKVIAPPPGCESNNVESVSVKTDSELKETEIRLVSSDEKSLEANSSSSSLNINKKLVDNSISYQGCSESEPSAICEPEDVDKVVKDLIADLLSRLEKTKDTPEALGSFVKKSVAYSNKRKSDGRSSRAATRNKRPAKRKATSTSENSKSSSSSSDEGDEDGDDDEIESDSKEQTRRRSKRGSNQPRSPAAFPTEFLDKRRSTRIQKQQTKGTKNDCDLYELLVRLLPEMMREKNIFDVVQDNDTSSFSVDSMSIEREAMNHFVTKLKSYRDGNCTKRIGDLIRDYLHEVGRNAYSTNPPPSFSELYRIHRRANPLPFAPFVVIGQHLELDEIWLTLAANEVNFVREEAIFLEQMLSALEGHLNDEAKYMQFDVRLVVLKAVQEKDESLLEELFNKLIDGEEEDINPDDVERNVQIISVAMAKSLVSSRYVNSSANVMELGRYQDLVNVVINVIETGRYDELMNLLV